ncbi:MAG TPA: hypothetical protein VK548_22705 [Candidatus Acidoferrum sp.]|nr:hypothetical protein [Candidatus Acidoferrum sp.]
MSWISEFLFLVARIPPAFWGVVVGSLLSLGGIVLTNRANDRRLREQFAQDRELRNRDRELALRKDVYLAAAEAISAGFISVSKFANLEAPPDKLTDDYVNKAPAIAKIHIIATEDTARAVANVMGELSATFLRLLAERVPLMIRKQQLTTLDDQIGSFGKERDRMVELMRQHNVEGIVDDRRWGVIKGTFEFEQGRVTEGLEQRKALAGTLYALQLEYTKDCVENTMRLGRLLVPAVVAIRKELGVPIDESAYLQIVEESLAKQREGLTEFMRRARHFLDDKTDGARDVG